MIGIEATYQVRPVTVAELAENMILAEDLKTMKGSLLTSKGMQISRPLLEFLKEAHFLPVVREPIKVLVPVK